VEACALSRHHEGVKQDETGLHLALTVGASVGIAARSLVAALVLLAIPGYVRWRRITATVPGGAAISPTGIEPDGNCKAAQ
jgi:hypothetical protein